MSSVTRKRPFGFAKPGARPLLMALIFAPFIAVGFLLFAATLWCWRGARDVNRYETTIVGKTRGRVRVSGPVSRARTVTSPLGRSGVGWVGAVGAVVKDSDGDVSFETVCVRGDLSELHIKSFLEDWSTTFVEPTDPVVLGGHSKLADALPIVDIGDPAAQDSPVPIPEAMQRACGSALTRSTKGPLTYREAVLAADAPIEMLGCADGWRVARCDDGGSYLLTTSTIAKLKERSRHEAALIMLFGGLWNLMIMAGVGFMVAGRLVRATPTFQERLRAK